MMTGVNNSFKIIRKIAGRQSFPRDFLLPLGGLNPPTLVVQYSNCASD